ncbi:MAG: hypothetical protein R3335_05245, partial [Anaerolineales bacterium]|nr:hypothetical protein [Anaerolineales bacterium]
GIAAGVGALVKMFPMLLVVIPWRYADRSSAIKFSAAAAGVFLLPIAALWALSPQMTSASIRAQVAKGPWETVWALLEGNLATGNFGADVIRTDPGSLSQIGAGSAGIPSWLTLIPFLAIGYILFRRVNQISNLSAVAFLGLTWCIFLLWSPGYSPQWVLYLLPLIILALPERTALLMSIVLLSVNLLEWPLLLSRGLFSSLWLVIPLRVGLLILLAVEFWRPCRVPEVKEAQIDLPA